MDIFRFHNPTAATKMEGGEIINGIDNKLWVEKYQEPGEFKFVGSVSSGLREKLPVGSFVSHIDTTEIMIVDNHEISETRGKDPEIVITGSGFESFLDHRIVGTNRAFPAITSELEYTLASGDTWDHAVTLLEDHLLVANLIDDNNALPYTSVLTDIVFTFSPVERAIPRGSLLQRLIELLQIDQIGIKVIRPGPWSPLGASPNTALVIHAGANKTSQVIFSYDTGEIESAEYLWSNKLYKNAALITGRWVEAFVYTADAGYDRRVMHVDGSFMDEGYTESPPPEDVPVIEYFLQLVGFDALARQRNIALTKAEIAQNTDLSVYRTDFFVGDIVTVHGNYNESSAMRISEYVEIEDENGVSGYPTLTMI